MYKTHMLIFINIIRFIFDSCCVNETLASAAVLRFFRVFRGCQF